MRTKKLINICFSWAEHRKTLIICQWNTGHKCSLQALYPDAARQGFKSYPFPSFRASSHRTYPFKHLRNSHREQLTRRMPGVNLQVRSKFPRSVEFFDSTEPKQRPCGNTGIQNTPLIPIHRVCNVCPYTFVIPAKVGIRKH